MNEKLSYRKRALAHYTDHRCLWCGFARADVLEAAHVDCNHDNIGLDNLVLLCPTCHRMHDIDLISTEELRARQVRVEPLATGEAGAAVKVVACHWCGFGLEPGMEAHGASALATAGPVLCPTCRARATRGLITEQELADRYTNRDRPPVWKKLSKEAAEKAGRKRSRQAAARRAVRTRAARKAQAWES
jgi:hypothetical protein